MERMSWQSRLFLKWIRMTRPLPGPQATPQQRRAALERLARLVVQARDVRVERISAAGLQVAWFTPPQARPGQAILYLHGGAYVTGSIHTHRGIVSNLARRAQTRVLVVEYRLAPEHPFPAALEDALTAYRWLRAQGLSAQSLALAGDSAGGGLTMATLLSLRDAREPLPSAAALISPWTDLLGTGETLRTRAGRDPLFVPSDLPRAARHYLNGHDPRDPLVSPVYARLENLPPVLIQVGDEELLLSDSTRLADGLRRGGTPVEISIWPGMFHVFHVAGNSLPESRQALIEMGTFLKTHISAP